MEIVELGAQLKQKRVAGGRTIAAVAAEAGLSVPYIANLENGRGNPTLAAVNRLARTLGTELALTDSEEAADQRHLEAVMTAMSALKGRPLTDRDRHRIEDVATLILG